MVTEAPPRKGTAVDFLGMVGALGSARATIRDMREVGDVDRAS